MLLDTGGKLKKKIVFQFLGGSCGAEWKSTRTVGVVAAWRGYPSTRNGPVGAYLRAKRGENGGELFSHSRISIGRISAGNESRHSLLLVEGSFLP
jgi:hypothetical protein